MSKKCPLSLSFAQGRCADFGPDEAPKGPFFHIKKYGPRVITRSVRLVEVSRQSL